MLHITMALKNEVNGIKSNHLNAKLDDMERETEALKNDILDLKDVLMQQKETILSLIATQNKKLAGTTEADKLAPHFVFSKKATKHIKMFPVKSIDELDKLKAFISDDNLNELVTIVQKLITPSGIVNNMMAVLSTECVIEFNLDEIHNKKRLLNYKKFMDLLFRAAYYDGYSKKTFLNEVRLALKTVKDRHYKTLFRNRNRLQKLEEQYNAEDYGEESEN